MAIRDRCRRWPPGPAPSTEHRSHLVRFFLTFDWMSGFFRASLEIFILERPLALHRRGTVTHRLFWDAARSLHAFVAPLSKKSNK